MGRKSQAGWPALLLGFRLHLEAQGRRPKTVANYLRDVAAFARSCPSPPAQVTPQDIAAYLAERRQQVSAKTVREQALALRRFFRWCVSEGELRRDPTQGLRLSSPRTPVMPAYTRTEVQRLLMACDRRRLLGLRDHAMVLVLFDTGMRVGELCSMTCEALDWERGVARVVGKTGPREVPLGRNALEALLRYMRRWGIEEGPVWRGERGPLTESGVLQAIKRLCYRSGVEAKGVHAFRRAAAIEMKRAGMNDSDILEVLGWHSVTMLKRYIAQEARTLAFKAHQQYSPGDRLKWPSLRGP
jgi:site-specific recombinase XerD